jgi:hypothetical protein
MGSKILAKQVRQAIGTKRLGWALLHKWPVGLRFELGDDWACRPLALYQAMYRSKMLLEYVFQDSDKVIVNLVCYAKRKTKRPTRQLEECGFILPAEHELSGQVDKDAPGHAL